MDPFNSSNENLMVGAYGMNTNPNPNVQMNINPNMQSNPNMNTGGFQQYPQNNNAFNVNQGYNQYPSNFPNAVNAGTNYPNPNMQVNVVQNNMGFQSGTPVGINCSFTPINMFGQQMQLVNEPMIALAQSNVCFIKQQIELLEIITGCETPNRYSVFAKNSFGQTILLFKCKEESECYTRMYCKGESRPFKMKVKHIANPNIDDDFMNTFAVFDRPFQCTCCCLARPELTGRFKDDSGAIIGKITEPCTLCDPHLDICDSKGILKYKVHGDCCQCGFCCRSDACGKCSEVIFPIFPAHVEDYSINNKIGAIRKVCSGVITELISDADNFEITFPVDATPEDKLMLIGATLMIDYRYYEENPSKSKTNNI